MRRLNKVRNWAGAISGSLFDTSRRSLLTDKLSEFSEEQAFYRELTATGLGAIGSSEVKSSSADLIHGVELFVSTNTGLWVIDHHGWRNLFGVGGFGVASDDDGKVYFAATPGLRDYVIEARIERDNEDRVTLVDKRVILAIEGRGHASRIHHLSWDENLKHLLVGKFCF